jgi:twinkle protein
MEILNFVKEHLGEHKIQGKEIVVKKCPFCGREKHKFSINFEKGLYQCFSGSCRSVGTIQQLYKKYGIQFRSEKEFTNSNANLDARKYLTNNTVELFEFFKSRGISESTIKRNFFDVFSTKQSEIAFVYRKNFDIASVKIRGIKEKKFHGKKYSDLTLWKLDFCDISKPLIICEGEIDQLSFEEQNIENVVSVPSGAGSLSWIDTDFDTLEKFKTIILAFDNDTAGQEATNKVIKRLPENCEIKKVNYMDYKDANEVIMNNLMLEDFIKNAELVEDEYFVTISDINQLESEKYSTGSLAWNRAIGGIRLGEVSIWTGKPGSGKSTILNQVMLEMAEQDVNCLLYTPELSDSQWKRWTARQMLGEEIKGRFYKKFDKVEQEDKFYVKEDISQKMSEWLDKKIKLVSAEFNFTAQEICRTIIKSIKKYNTKFIIIDNLMKILFQGNDLYEEQKDFLNSLSSIAKKYDVNINLVAHPKKHDADNPDQYDIAGSSNIPNLVDNIYYFRRITEHCLENGFKKKADFLTENNINTAFMSLKSREGKNIGDWIFFNFDIARKRINYYEEKPNYNTMWESEKTNKDYIWIEEELPF